MKHCTIFIFTLLVLICNNTHPLNATNDEQAVKESLSTFQQSWNTHNMAAFSELFAEDADFVNVRGTRWIGRAAIKDAHEQSHAWQFKTSQLTIHETSIRFLKPDIAVTRSLWELVGHTTPTGEVGEPRKGFLTNVIAKQNGKWKIIVTQNTDIVPLK